MSVIFSQGRDSQKNMTEGGGGGGGRSESWAET